MGELTDKIKGNVNEAIGKVKQRERRSRQRAPKAQLRSSKGKVQQLKGRSQGRARQQDLIGRAVSPVTRRAGPRGPWRAGSARRRPASPGNPPSSAGPRHSIAISAWAIAPPSVSPGPSRMIRSGAYSLHRDLDGAGEIVGFEDLGGEGVVAAAPRHRWRSGRQIWPRPSIIGSAGPAEPVGGQAAIARVRRALHQRAVEGAVIDQPQRLAAGRRRRFGEQGGEAGLVAGERRASRRARSRR